ncbi:MAG TPA: methyltransferase [Thermoanaerobaculia bacterium]
MKDEATAPPSARVLQMMMGSWVSQILGVCSRLGVADLISDGVSSSDAIAEKCGSDPEATYRLLRAGAAVGLFSEEAERKFHLTPLGECIRTNTPGSLRDLIVAETAPGHWLPWGRLYDVVMRGASVASDTLGMGTWEYYAAHPEEAQWFARGMGNLSAMVSEDVARLYDASDRRSIVDVGGSQGVLLTGLLRQGGQARGILFDRPEVIQQARAVVEASPLRDRIALVEGDFFSSIPAGADLYVLKSILHDWPDGECERILRNVHAAAAPGANLLIVEMIVPEEPQPSPVALMDMNMLVMLNGRERTAGDFEKLLNATGFSLVRILQTSGLFALIEGRRV